MDPFHLLLYTAFILTLNLAVAQKLESPENTVEKVEIKDVSVLKINGTKTKLHGKNKKNKGLRARQKNKNNSGKLKENVWWPWKTYEEWSESRKIAQNITETQLTNKTKIHQKKKINQKKRKDRKKKKSKKIKVQINIAKIMDKKPQKDFNNEIPDTFQQLLPSFKMKYIRATKQNFTSDKNECLVNNGGCEGLCVNTIGSYKCHCPEGFRLDSLKKNCIDVNECIVRNGHGPCQGECYNRWGTFECGCISIPGTELANDGKSCQVVDACSKEKCSHLCINTRSGAFCACPQGFVLASDWQNCVDVNECLQKDLQNPPCLNNCTNTDGSYICS